ncbi:hypothetical protein V6Z12_A13G123100 [Gossypium hirsutum]
MFSVKKKNDDALQVLSYKCYPTRAVVRLTTTRITLLRQKLILRKPGFAVAVFDTIMGQSLGGGPNHWS